MNIKDLIVFLVLPVIMASCDSHNGDRLVVATSANMQYAIRDLVATFTEITQIECDVVIQSSGMLTAQIQEGAPYDVFVSADLKNPTHLYNNGHALSAPMVYARGSLVLWTMREDIDLSIENLMGDNVKHIAIANPKVAPYGEAAIQFLKNRKVYDQIKEKLVYGESISQVNHFILSKSADMGISSKSTVVSSPDLYNKKWKNLSETYYTPIRQGAVIVNNRRDKQRESSKFIEFLVSSKSKQILVKNGYDVEDL